MTQRNRFALSRRSSRKAQRSKTSVYRRFPLAGLEQLELRALLSASPASADSALLGSANAWESDSASFSLRSMLASCSRSSSPTTDAGAAAPAVSPLAATSYSTLDAPQSDPGSDITADPAAATGGEPVVSPLVGTELATFRLEAQDLNDNVIDTVAVGSDFQLVAWVNDIRDPAAQFPGVWAAFMNVVYSSSLVSITATPNVQNPNDPGNNGDLGIEWGPYFQHGLRFGNLGTPGQISEIGSASLASVQSGPGEELLFKITVHASAAGTVTFTPSFDSNVDHESSFIDPADALTAAQINFVPLSVTISGPPIVSITPSVSHNEGNTGNSPTTPYVFDVTLSQASDSPTKVTYTTSNGTTQAGDFVAQTGTLTFAAGETSKSVTIGVVGDTAVEADETFNVTLSNPVGLTLGANAVGVGTIVNDDVSLLGVAAVSQLEGNADNNLVFEVTLSTASPTQVVVPYTTADGTAVSTGGSADYTATSGTLTFAAGSAQSQFVTVTIHGDAVNESNETFQLLLSKPANVDFDASGGAATATLLNDDGPHISFSQQGVSHTEGNSGLTEYVFTVDLGATTDIPVTVQYSTANGTATSPSDYVPTSGTLTFLPDGAKRRTLRSKSTAIRCRRRTRHSC